jgi:hypothetical protein
MGEKFGEVGYLKITISTNKFQCIGVGCRREGAFGILAVACGKPLFVYNKLSFLAIFA